MAATKPGQGQALLDEVVALLAQDFPPASGEGKCQLQVDVDVYPDGRCLYTWTWRRS
jgi:hypothetical protein